MPKRRAKLIDVAKIPGLSTGTDQGASGPFQDQEMVAERSPDQPKSINSASKAVRSSSDSETEDVNVQSESEDELPPPRNAIRAAIDETLDEYHMVLGKKRNKTTAEGRQSGRAGQAE